MNRESQHTETETADNDVVEQLDPNHLRTSREFDSNMIAIAGSMATAGRVAARIRDVDLKLCIHLFLQSREA